MPIIDTHTYKISSPNMTTVGKVPIDVNMRRSQHNQHFPIISSKNVDFSAPYETSTIFPYTPKKRLRRKSIFKKEVSQYHSYNKKICQSKKKTISCKSRRHENYDGLKQKNKHTAKQVYDGDQGKVNVPKQPISLGITRIKNVCVSLFTRRKKNTSKFHDNCKDRLYQTTLLKIPRKRRSSFVTSVICTSSKSDTQPKKRVTVRTKKPNSLANHKILEHKAGTKYCNLISKQPFEAYHQQYPQYQSGDANEQVLNAPDICINNKYSDVECQKEILSNFCKPRYDIGKYFNSYARNYTVGYAFRSRKQKHNCHHPCAHGIQSSSLGLCKHAKSETKDKDCNAHCNSHTMKGILKKKSKSVSCCDVCCYHKNRANGPEKGKNRGSVGRKTNERRRSTPEGEEYYENHEEYRGYDRRKKQKKRKFNKNHNTSRAVCPKPCDNTCLVNLTREGRLERPKPKKQKPIRFRKTCRADCKHMKHLERVKIMKEEKLIKEARSQTNKMISKSFLRNISNKIVGSFDKSKKSKPSVVQQNNVTSSAPLFEIHIDSKDYRVLNREQTMYSISEWQRKEMERRKVEARHGKHCRCCVCVRSALRQSSLTRQRSDKTDMVLNNPSIVECVCGSSVCDKERKKMIDQLEQQISKQQPRKKPCICGSRICSRDAASKKKTSKLRGKETGKIQGKKDKKKDNKHDKEKQKKEKMREKKKKNTNKDKRKKQLEKVQEKLQRKQEKKKEKLEREKEKKQMKVPKKPRKTAKQLLDEKMKNFSDARKKDYENWLKSREFKRDNKYEVAARARHKYYVAKMNRLESHATQERSERDMQLIARSIADLWDVSATCVQSAARQTYRRIMQPEPKVKHIKRQNFKTNQYVVNTTFKNIHRRLLLTKAFSFIAKLFGGSNRYRRRRRSTENWGCNMYMQTLRVKRCSWLYKACPWFYPYCLNIITVWRHFAFFVLFFVGAILWTPCFFCVELCNFLWCCRC